MSAKNITPLQLFSSAPDSGSPEVMSGEEVLSSSSSSLLRSVFPSVPDLLRVYGHLPDARLADFSWPDNFANKAFLPASRRRQLLSAKDFGGAPKAKQCSSQRGVKKKYIKKAL